MEQLLNSLLLLLDDATSLYRSLLTLYHEEHQSLLAFEPDGISATAKKKENLILKIKILEEQRKRTTNRIAEYLGQPASDLTITRLAEKVDIRYSYKLSAVGDELSEVINQIKVLHQTNRSLITHSQELVNSSLAFLNNTLAPDPVYYRNGTVSTQDQNGRLLTRTI